MMWNDKNIGDLTGKVYVVTGGNTGLGYGTTRYLLEAGARVIFTARDAHKGQAALGRLTEYGGSRVRLETLNLESFDSVEQLTERLLADEQRIDALVLNAGVAMLPYSTTVEGVETHFAVNHLGHFALTLPLAPITVRVVVTTSGGAHQAEKPLPFDKLAMRDNGDSYDGLQVYCDSKLANVLFARGLKRRRPDLEVVVTHPGYTATDLQRHSLRFRILNKLMAQPVETGALCNVRAGVDPSVGELGPSEWVCPGGRREMSGEPAVRATVPEYANDEEAQDTLWRLSESLSGITLAN